MLEGRFLHQTVLLHPYHMNSIFATIPFQPIALPFLRLGPNRSPLPQYGFYNPLSSVYGQCSSVLPIFARNRGTSDRVVSPDNEGTVKMVDFEELMEKDWSFLEFADRISEEEHNRKIDQIISAGEIGKASKVLVSIGSEHFIDRVISSSPCEQVFVVHDSLFTLACIKEKYDSVKCLQGELISLPEDWVGLDVVFLYFLPALPFHLNQILEFFAKHCSPGARIVISHPLGRQMVREQQKQFPDVVVGELPEKITLQDYLAGPESSFESVKFVDEDGFYLAVLKLKGE